jgi:hypothetical protein
MNSIDVPDEDCKFLTLEQMTQILTQEIQQSADTNHQRSKNHARWICKQPTNSYANILKRDLSMQIGTALYLTELLKEILQMSLREKTDISSPQRCVYSSKRNLQRTIQIGRLINKVRGIEGMQFVASKIPDYDRTEINQCWDDIGEWQS